MNLDGLIFCGLLLALGVCVLAEVGSIVVLLALAFLEDTDR